jgi:hypothetical protein
VYLFPLRVAWGARGADPPRLTGSPPSAVMGRAGGAAGLPVRAVALDDGGECGWGAGHMAVFCNPQARVWVQLTRCRGAGRRTRTG